MKQLRIIQVGVGFWGWSWVQVALESPHWELVGIVEKPLALVMDEARKMVHSADNTGKKLMVSQNYRYKRAPQTIKSFLGRDVIGGVGSVFVNFQKAPHLTGFRIEIDEPLITDMAIHHFDQMRHVLGTDAAWVLAHSWNTDWSRFRGNTVANVVFEMKNKTVVSYTGNWVSRGWETPWDGDWHIECSGGELRWTRNEVAFRTTNLLQEVYTKDALERGGELTLDLIDMVEEDRWACLAELAAAIHEEREPLTSGRDNLGSLAMVIGACKSISEQRPVAMKEILEE